MIIDPKIITFLHWIIYIFKAYCIVRKLLDIPCKIEFAQVLFQPWS